MNIFNMLREPWTDIFSLEMISKTIEIRVNSKVIDPIYMFILGGRMINGVYLGNI